MSGGIDERVEPETGTTAQRNATMFNTNGGPLRSEGLTPDQEDAAMLIASGMAIQDVAEELDVHRSTVWRWRQLETFQAYLNSLRREAKLDALDRLLSLQAKALETVRRVMEEGNDSSALNAARYVLEQAEEVQVASADPRDIVRTLHTTDGYSEMLEQMNNGTFDEQGYRERCEELGLEP